MGDAYDETQTNRHIEDGDVLIVGDGFAVMMKAWPTMVEGHSVMFHRLNEDYTFDDVYFNEGDDYRAQVKEIRNNPEALIARALDPVKERLEEERAEQCDWDQRSQYLLDDA
jgi:hypothetical protein